MRGRAYYNSLQFKCRQHDDVPDWKVEDYRALDEATLFRRLKKLGVKVDQEGFILYAKSADTAHELVEHLAPKEASDEEREKIYLLAFELWRRLVPEKLSLSIFCDELDHQIYLYNEGEVDEEVLAVLLSRLESILDSSVDDEQSPVEVFNVVKSFFGHNLEAFLYDFCSHLIDCERRTLASECIGGYYDYIEDKLWFDFLKMRLQAEEDLTEADEIITRFFVNMMEAPNFDLCLELLEFLADVGKSNLFYQIYQAVIPLVKTEEDFKMMLKTVAAFYQGVDDESEHEFVSRILDGQKGMEPGARKQLEQMILEALDQQ